MYEPRVVYDSAGAVGSLYMFYCERLISQLSETYTVYYLTPAEAARGEFNVLYLSLRLSAALRALIHDKPFVMSVRNNITTLELSLEAPCTSQ